MLPLLVKCTSTIIFYDGTDNMDDVQSGLNKAQDSGGKHNNPYRISGELDSQIF